MSLLGAKKSRKKPVVLVADDESEIRHLLKEALELYGFDVVEAVDGMEALRIFKEIRPNLVISDIYMPFLNGVVLLNKIKILAIYTPVILITGYSHYKQLLDGSRFPPDGFIEKPFSIEELHATVTRVISYKTRR